MSSKTWNLITAAAVFAFSFIIYLSTLAPTVWFIDSGELSAVASTLGIAHPTGYPLFTIIGHLFTLLPVSSSEVYKLNLMSTFFCSLGIFVFVYLMKFLLEWQTAYPIPEKGKKTQHIKDAEKHTPAPQIVVYGIIIFSSLLLAFSRTFWDSANAVEVYPIHILFVITLVLLFLKAVKEKPADKDISFLSANKYYLMFAFVLGLSFTNHLTTILLAPACLTLFLVDNSADTKKMIRLFGAMALCFIIGLTPYLYLPIRASMNPTFLWGNPYNLERLYWHVTAKQFSVWIFSAKGSVPVFLMLLGILITLAAVGLKKLKTINKNYHIAAFGAVAVLTFLFYSSASEIVTKQFSAFTDSLWGEFGKGLILFAVPGIYKLSRFNTKIYYFTFLTFFGCLLYSVNYDIHDIYSYFLLSYITIAVWIGFGALYLYEFLSSYMLTNIHRAALSGALIVLSLIALNTNYSENDESGNYYIEQFTMNVFRNIEPNGIVISSQWDFWVSASWYFNFVKHIRPDITVIDKELLRRSWYYTYLQRNYPEIYNNSKAEIERFLSELYKFEHNIPYDTKYIMKLFSELLTSFVENNQGRRIYTTWEIEQNKNEPFAANFSRIPDGLLFRLVNSDSLKNNPAQDYKIYDFSFTPNTKDDYYHKTLMMSYAMMLTGSAGYLVTVNRVDDAKKYLNLALTAIPGFPQALELKKKFNL